MPETHTPRLSGRVALVTGAASDRGIGRAIAMAYAHHGAAVACVDVDEAGSLAAASALREIGGKAVAVTCDVSDNEQVLSAVTRTVETFGRLDILVNNAGFARFHRLLDVSVDEWDRLMDVNLKGPFLFAQAAAQQMITQRTGGCIVNLSSMSADRADEMKVPYCVSKAGVKMLTQGAAIEWSAHNIRVNAIAPGDIVTNIVQDQPILRAIEQGDLASAVPLGRRGMPEDVVGAAVFLASDEAAYITGVHLLIDGGICAGNKFALTL